MISNKRRPFLKTVLKNFSLVELLPFYVESITKDNETYKYLPSTLVDGVVESLKTFQDEIPKTIIEKLENVDILKLIKMLSDLEPSEFLLCYIESVTDSTDFFAQISEPVKENALFWVNELVDSIKDENGFFSSQVNLEEYVDKFVDYAGGKRVTQLITIKDSQKNADYAFVNDNVIIELKIIETDFVSNNQARLNEVWLEWRNKNIITAEMILGLGIGEIRELIENQLKILRVPLQRLMKEANKQIRETKNLLNLLNAQGLVFILIDGFYSLTPYLTIELINEPLSRQFHSIDGFVFMNLRRRIYLNLEGLDGGHYLIYEPRTRLGIPKAFSDFINDLGKKWFEFPQLMTGKTFGISVKSHNPDNLRNASWERK